MCGLCVCVYSAAEAKGFNWGAVSMMLERQPDLINCQPLFRWSALHQAVKAPARNQLIHTVLYG